MSTSRGQSHLRQLIEVGLDPLEQLTTFVSGAYQRHILNVIRYSQLIVSPCLKTGPFRSIIFLLVSLLMAIANFKIRNKTKSSLTLTLLSIIGLRMGAALILYYEFTTKWEQMLMIILLYLFLAGGAWKFSNNNHRETKKA